MTISSAIVQAQRLVTMAQAHLRSLLLTAVVEAHGSECYYCHVPTLIDPPAGKCHLERTLDHVIPLSRGGPDDVSNVVCCCRSCNSRKGVRPIQQYAIRREGR
jgi:5-methylcytosine-specific restriction endonuclease McrA